MTNMIRPPKRYHFLFFCNMKLSFQINRYLCYLCLHCLLYLMSRTYVANDLAPSHSELSTLTLPPDLNSNPTIRPILLPFVCYAMYCLIFLLPLKVPIYDYCRIHLFVFTTLSKFTSAIVDFPLPSAF